MAPESGTDLKGLSALLEKCESEKRKKLKKERPVEPVRGGGLLILSNKMIDKKS
ncbi:hypothetical protein QUF70_16345 [Desulfobacterales bacterium HSG17]|nr:hypothetical protein [Desulfobacterales bacterium HSG17]